MPVYEYKCEKCGEKFELLVRSSDQTICCKKCGSSEVTKLVSTFSTGAPSCSPGAIT